MISAEDAGPEADRGRADRHLHPAAGRRSRDHRRPDLERDPGAAAASRASWRCCSSDPALAAGAVEETLRYDAPVQMTGRVARGGMQIGTVAARDGALSCCCSPRPAGTRTSSPTRTRSISAAAPPATWRSRPGRISAWGRRWPGWRRPLRCRSSRPGWPRRSSTRTHCGTSPTSTCVALTSLSCISPASALGDRRLPALSPGTPAAVRPCPPGARPPQSGPRSRRPPQSPRRWPGAARRCGRCCAAAPGWR